MLKFFMAGNDFTVKAQGATLGLSSAGSLSSGSCSTSSPVAFPTVTSDSSSVWWEWLFLVRLDQWMLPQLGLSGSS